jgi:uncharacterized membrane protein
MANLTIHGPAAAPFVGVRRIGLEDLKIALAQGLDDYWAKRGELLYLGLIYPIVGFAAFMVAFRADLLPLAFPLAAGISLMGPPVASGFYELSRRRELGEDPSWIDTLAIFKTPPFTGIAALTGCVGVLFAIWVMLAGAIYTATLGAAAPPASAGAFLSRLLTTPAGWTLIVVGNLVGLVFAVAALSISVISFPMLVDRRAGPLTAAETSLRAVAANPKTFAAWGLIVAGLLVIGSIPLFVGLAVVLPILGYSTWRLYTRVVER